MCALTLCSMQNMELVNPAFDRRSATLMSRAKARNAFVCAMSGNRLPYCQMQESIKTWDDDAFSEAPDLLEESATEGFLLGGVKQSCDVQGGCMLPHKFFSGMFDGTYLLRTGDESTDHTESIASERTAQYVRHINSEKKLPANELFLLSDVNHTFTARAGWMHRKVNVTFSALVLPGSPDLAVSLCNRIPFYAPFRPCKRKVGPFFT